MAAAASASHFIRSLSQRRALPCDWERLRCDIILAPRTFCSPWRDGCSLLVHLVFVSPVGISSFTVSKLPYCAISSMFLYIYKICLPHRPHQLLGFTGDSSPMSISNMTRLGIPIFFKQHQANYHIAEQGFLSRFSHRMISCYYGHVYSAYKMIKRLG